MICMQVHLFPGAEPGQWQPTAVARGSIRPLPSSPQSRLDLPRRPQPRRGFSRRDMGFQHSMSGYVPARAARVSADGLAASPCGPGHPARVRRKRT